MHPKPLYLLATFGILLLSCNEKRPAVTPAQPAIHKYDPDSAVLFTRLDTTEIFRRLFDNPTMKGDTAVWEPNFYEKQSIQLSYDDSCHTTLDTIMYFKDQGKRDCAVFIFVTYHYIIDGADRSKIRFGSCHSCGAPLSVALFSHDTSGPWQLYKFEKFLTTSGIFGGSGVGGLGKFSLLSIGDSWTCLQLQRPIYANMQREQGTAELYSIEEFYLGGFPQQPLTSILSYDYHSAETDASGTPIKLTKTELEIIKKKEQYYIIKLATNTNGVRKSKYYRYSEEYNSCIEYNIKDHRSVM